MFHGKVSTSNDLVYIMSDSPFTAPQTQRTSSVPQDQQEQQVQEPRPRLSDDIRNDFVHPQNVPAHQANFYSNQAPITFLVQGQTTYFNYPATQQPPYPPQLAYPGAGSMEFFHQREYYPQDHFEQQGCYPQQVSYPQNGFYPQQDYYPQNGFYPQQGYYPPPAYSTYPTPMPQQVAASRPVAVPPNWRPRQPGERSRAELGRRIPEWEYERRKMENRCLVCGGGGHWARLCPYDLGKKWRKWENLCAADAVRQNAVRGDNDGRGDCAGYQGPRDARPPPPARKLNVEAPPFVHVEHNGKVALDETAKPNGAVEPTEGLQNRARGDSNGSNEDDDEEGSKIPWMRYQANADPQLNDTVKQNGTSGLDGIVEQNEITDQIEEQ